MSSEKGKAWKKGIYVEKLIINCSVGESGDRRALRRCINDFSKISKKNRKIVDASTRVRRQARRSFEKKSAT